MSWLFEQQYELTLTEVVEIRTRTTSSTDPETGETTTEEEDYEYYILNVKLRNKGLNSVISNSGLSEDDMERYRILLQTRGNRPDIFGNDIYATPGGEYTDYDIPGEAPTGLVPTMDFFAALLTIMHSTMSPSPLITSHEANANSCSCCTKALCIVSSAVG